MTQTRGNVADPATVGASVTDISELLQRDDTTIAGVGATDDPDKYGSVIYRDLKAKGFRVYPVNIHRSTVDGDRAYRTLADLPDRPTIVNIVVPADQTLRVLRQAREAGHENVWVQPGAEDRAVLDYLDIAGFTYLANACIMTRSRHLEVDPLRS